MFQQKSQGEESRFDGYYVRLSWLSTVVQILRSWGIVSPSMILPLWNTDGGDNKENRVLLGQFLGVEMPRSASHFRPVVLAMEIQEVIGGEWVGLKGYYAYRIILPGTVQRDHTPLEHPSIYFTPARS